MSYVDDWLEPLFAHSKIIDSDAFDNRFGVA